MFVALELAHLAFHQCSLCSGHGPLPKGYYGEFIDVTEKVYTTKKLTG